MVDLSLVKKNDLWYTIGLIATDGNLSSSGRHINITSKDTGHLKLIRHVLGLTNKIGVKVGGTGSICSILQFGDVNFYKFLENIGLTKNKSRTLRPLKIPEKYFKDFLRGVIDGDGNIQETVHTGNGNIQWVLRIVSASPHFLPWLENVIKKAFGVDGRFHVNKSPGRNPLYILKYGKFAAKIILRGCYYKNALAMERKLKKAQKCIQSKNGLSKYGKLKAS